VLCSSDPIAAADSGATCLGDSSIPFGHSRPATLPGQSGLGSVRIDAESRARANAPYSGGPPRSEARNGIPGLSRSPLRAVHRRCHSRSEPSSNDCSCTPLALSTARPARRSLLRREITSRRLDSIPRNQSGSHSSSTGVPSDRFSFYGPVGVACRGARHALATAPAIVALLETAARTNRRPFCKALRFAAVQPRIAGASPTPRIARRPARC